MFIPELLAPAGHIDKLKTAVLYGADAVYLAGQRYGLRAAADNFTSQELAEGVSFARERGVKAYITLNSFFHDQDFQGLKEFLGLLESIGVDAAIVSDLGVIRFIAENSSIPVHLSTQASCLNVEAAKFWKSQGVSRVVLGREVSFAEGGHIKKEAGVEVEMFVHGAMCMAYSGNCVISNYTKGRDSNRGGCAHSCRFEYSLESEEETRRSHFMSSKDLEGIRLLQEASYYEIDSLKIEGRMKGPLYAGVTSRVYSQALRYLGEHGSFEGAEFEEWETELRTLRGRSHTTASLNSPASADSIFDEREHAESDYVVAGEVLEALPGGAAVFVRNGFRPGQELELIPFRGKVRSVLCRTKGFISTAINC